MSMEKIILQHNTQSLTIFLCTERLSITAENLTHPPYSLDLAPSENHLFEFSKNQMQGEYYATNEVVQRAISFPS